MQDEKIVISVKQTRPQAIDRVRQSVQLVCVHREVYCMPRVWNYVGPVAAVRLVLKKHMEILGPRQH